MVSERIHKRGQGRDPEALRLILEDEDVWEALSLSTSEPPRVCDEPGHRCSLGRADSLLTTPWPPFYLTFLNFASISMVTGVGVRSQP